MSPSHIFSIYSDANRWYGTPTNQPKDPEMTNFSEKSIETLVSTTRAIDQVVAQLEVLEKDPQIAAAIEKLLIGAAKLSFLVMSEELKS